MKKKTLTVLAGLSLAFAGSTTANATELVFQFQSPSFGGNPMNASFLQYITSSQNDKKAKSMVSDGDDEISSILDGFEETVRRSVLSQLSREITQRVFGEDGALLGEQDSINAAGFQIDVVEELDGIVVTILDEITGSSTTVKLPFF